MTLVHNWLHILKRAWSIRLILVAGLLTGAEAMLALTDAELFGIPQGTFAFVAMLINGAAFVARLLAQQGVSHVEEDHEPVSER